MEDHADTHGMYIVNTTDLNITGRAVILTDERLVKHLE
jgi:hypothetical protein